MRNALLRGRTGVPEAKPPMQAHSSLCLDGREVTSTSIPSAKPKSVGQGRTLGSQQGWEGTYLLTSNTVDLRGGVCHSHLARGPGGPLEESRSQEARIENPQSSPTWAHMALT